ncbi:MAG TPA: ABC transporter substrate-binding protein [Xanthobacteraceae bacterium]|jgi:putative ABC transport system substrate-binding protein|nr:ABC transporter substrate-binding protein [Xanthobacteraceae bacterium]
MRRRAFVAGIAGFLAQPWASYAVSPARRYRIGFLDTAPRERNVNFAAFQQVLFDRGYAEGRNLTFEYRSASGRNSGFAELANELASLKVDVIVTRGTPAALAARSATAIIPVVMAAAGDPFGIARREDRPAPNMTGFGASARGAERKRIEILKEMLPDMSRIAAITNLSNPSRQAEWQEVEAAARDLNVEPRVFDVRVAADIERAFDLALSWDAGALVVGSDTLIQTNQDRVIQLAASHRLPAVYTFRDFVDAGGLVSYGASLSDLYRRAADYVDKILMGAQPRDLPIEPGGDLELVVNAKTASSLGIAVPAAMMSRAQRVE